MSEKNIKEYQKLVRDKIPEIIRSSGKFCETRVLSDEEFAEALKAKLVEEANEFAQSGNPEELADLYEVVKYILVINNWNFEQIANIADKKAQERGAFEQKIFLEKSEV